MDISAEIAAIQAASQGSELRQPLVGALNKLNSGALPAVTSSDAGKILKVGANGWEVGEKSGFMPVPTATKQITENGTYDVANYASAVVNVSGGGGSSTVSDFDWDLHFLPSGIDISNSLWVDSVQGKEIPLASQCTKSINDTLVVPSDTAFSSSNMYVPVLGSYMIAKIKCKIPTNYTPNNATAWYLASTILGTELGGTARDWGIVINNSGYVSIGHTFDTIIPTSLKINDGNFHELMLMYVPQSYSNYISLSMLFHDGDFGVIDQRYNSQTTTTQFSKLGVFWNYNSNTTKVNGEIKEIAIKYLYNYT